MFKVAILDVFNKILLHNIIIFRSSAAVLTSTEFQHLLALFSFRKFTVLVHSLHFHQPHFQMQRVAKKPKG